MDYKFGQKNNWRRTIWNDIKERLMVPAREAVVLYLGGDNDLDRDVAINKGFRDNNLIFVDKSKKLVGDRRSEGSLALHADLFDVVFSWPSERRVDVVFGDFCCGLENGILNKALASLFRPQCRESVFAFNFLRGRDPSTNYARKMYEDDGVEMKHRGAMLWVTIAKLLACGFAGGVEFLDGEIRQSHMDDATREKANEFLEAIRNLSPCACRSYRSTSGQRFDSCVYANPLRNAKKMFRKSEALKDVSTARQIAAILAHRTMRMN